MYKTLAGRLSATFNLDGNHLERYLERENQIVASLCEDLILHDRILIPTQDYLTACGLALILGEKNFIALLEEERIQFLRTSGVFGYLRGTSRDGSLVVVQRNEGNSPQDCAIDEAVTAGLKVIDGKLKDKDLLSKLLIKNSEALSLSDLIDSVRRDSYSDLKGTSLWKTGYNYPHKDRIALPKMETMQMRVLGPGTDPQNNPVDLLLSLTLFNVELVLASMHDCVSGSTASPLGDSIGLKVARLTEQRIVADKFWSLLEINRVPDFSKADFSKKENFTELLKCLSSSKTDVFRRWFHERKNLPEKELFAEYLNVVNEIPFIQTLPLTILRFAVTTTLDLVPIVGKVASALDTFVVERVLRGKSPKYFIEDLKTFTGFLRPK